MAMGSKIFFSRQGLRRYTAVSLSETNHTKKQVGMGSNQMGSARNSPDNYNYTMECILKNHKRCKGLRGCGCPCHKVKGE